MLNCSDIPDISYDPLRYCLREDIIDQDGLWLEFGVWKGQTLNLISNYTDNNVYGFDTFCGLDEEWSGVEHGSMKKFDIGGIPPTSVIPIDPEIRNGPNIGKEKAFSNNVKFVVGKFENTLENFLIEKNKKISFIHMDCDIYKSCNYVLNVCIEYIKKGCIIVFDEYTNYIGWEEHEHKAFSEYVERFQVYFDWIGMDGYVLSDDELKQKAFYKNGIYSMRNISVAVQQWGSCP